MNILTSKSCSAISSFDVDGYEAGFRCLLMVPMGCGDSRRVGEKDMVRLIHTAGYLTS